jgi:hypothetical protein
MSRSLKKSLCLQCFVLIAILWVSFLFPFENARAEIVLDYFIASAQSDGVLLEWETKSESDSNGFYIYRSTLADRDFIRLNIFFLSDSETGEGVFYSYLDDEVTPGYIYYYKLEAIDFNGTRTMYGPISVNYRAQITRTPTATLRGGIATTTPTATRTPTLGTAAATQHTSTPTLTPTGLVLLLPSPTVSPTATPEGDVTAEPTRTPTLAPLPIFEFLFPAPTDTPVPSPTALQAQITSEPALAAQPAPEPLSRRHLILLGIIFFLWIFVMVFYIFLVRNFVHYFEEVDEANG